MGTEYHEGQLRESSEILQLGHLQMVDELA